MHLITSRTLITNIARELLVGSALQILSSSEFMAPSSDSEAAYQPQNKITPLRLTAVSAFVKCFLISVSFYFKIQVDQTFWRFGSLYSSEPPAVKLLFWSNSLGSKTTGPFPPVGACNLSPSSWLRQNGIKETEKHRMDLCNLRYQTGYDRQIGVSKGPKSQILLSNNTDINVTVSEGNVLGLRS